MGPTSREVRQGNERSYLREFDLTPDRFLVRSYSLIAPSEHLGSSEMNAPFLNAGGLEHMMQGSFHTTQTLAH